MPFTGLHPDAPRFYAELQRNNEREWWLANKRRYDENVRAPVEALVDELAPEFGPIKVFRPYRDVRFSTDKTPYKDHIAFVTQSDSGALYGQLSHEGLLLAGGFYGPASDQLARFRAIVDDNRLVGDLEATLEEVAEQGFEIMDDDALTTAPRGFTADHPKIELLRLRNLAVSARYPIEKWMFEPTALERVRAAWRTVKIWNDWLEENVGPSTRPSAR